LNQKAYPNQLMKPK